MINKDINLAHKIIDESEYAVISMIDEQGFPYAVALSMVRIDDKFYFHTAHKGLKTEYLAKNNNVCITAVVNTKLVPEDYSSDFESLLAKGKAYEVIKDDEKIEVLRVICQKYASSHMQMFEKVIEKSLKATAIWSIEISDFSCKVKQRKHP